MIRIASQSVAHQSQKDKFSVLFWILPDPSSPSLILEASSTFVVPLERRHAYQSPFWKVAGPPSQFVLTCWTKTSSASLQEHNHRAIWTRRDRFWTWFCPEHTTNMMFRYKKSRTALTARFKVSRADFTLLSTDWLTDSLTHKAIP